MEWLDANMPDAGACADFYDVSSSISLSVYPNPVKDNGMMKIRSNAVQQVNISVVDMDGRLLMQWTQSLLKGNNLIELHSYRWASGIYFIKVTNQGKEQFHQKLVKL
jgi:hypothetical protein